MGRENHQRSGRYLGQILHKHRPLLAKMLDHPPVMHDLMINIHGRAKPPERCF
jgi:hypothetical protein